MDEEDKENQEIEEDSSTEQNPKPSISPNKDFHFMW